MIGNGYVQTLVAVYQRFGKYINPFVQDFGGNPI